MKLDNGMSLSPQRSQYPWSYLLVEETDNGFCLRLTYGLYLNETHYIEAVEIIARRTLAVSARAGFDLLSIRQRHFHAACLQIVDRYRKEGR